MDVARIGPHRLTTNTAIISKRMKGGSGKWSILAGKISRNVSPQIDRDMQRAPYWEDPKFRLANIRGKSVVELKVALSPKGEKRLGNHSHLKGVPKLKVRNPTKLRCEGDSGKWNAVYKYSWELTDV